MCIRELNLEENIFYMRKIIQFFLFLLLAQANILLGEGIRFNDILGDNFFSAIRNGNYNRVIVPSIDERQFYENINPKFKKIIIAQADKILNEEIVNLSLYDYLATAKTGDRRKYETPYFNRRNNLMILTVACAISNDTKKYLPKIIEYLGAIIQEEFWCVYAHAAYSPNDIMVSIETKSRCDLFGSATASEIGIVLAILDKPLREFSSGFVDYVREKTLEKSIYFYLDDANDKLHWWGDPANNTFLNNWTPWCSASLLCAAVTLQLPPADLEKLIRKLNINISKYYNFFPDNGYCEEGATYWVVSAGNFLSYIEIINKIRTDSIKSLTQTQKFKNIAEFPLKLLVNDNLCASFADASAYYEVPVHLFRRYGEACNSARLLAAADKYADLIDEKQLLENVSNNPYLHLMQISDKKSGVNQSSVNEKRLDYFAPNFVMAGENNNFLVNLKGGNNDESHNHNDLGHFSIYYQGKPFVIDVGTMRYGTKNFSDQRYEIWYVNGEGHNAPVINGIMQQYGKNFTATVLLWFNIRIIFA
ncbi:MAG: heparinase II/III family protein [Lentisphaeria bacterium]|nr:heparinase II/III family protein [Lentisphaeria bacterium]